MSWYIETEEQRKAREEANKVMFMKMMDEAREKAEARKRWEASACPHCGRNDPLPPWLY